MARAVDGLDSKPYPGRRDETRFGSTSSGLCKDGFPDELSGLHPYKDVDFAIDLHPGTSPISMTLHRMVLVEL